MPYTRSLPSLTTPITLVEIFYEPYDYSLDTPWVGWGNRVGYRTTRVVSDEWSMFLPATSTIRAISASHIVVRWREADFTDAPYVTEGPALPTTGRLSPEPPLHTGVSSTVIAILALGVTLVVVAILLYLRHYRARRRSWRDFHGLELDDAGPNIGCLVLHNERNIDSEIMADIVFVHGLNGHRTRTWTMDGCCWPRDLLPQTLPGIRVITFGYDSRIVRWAGTSSNSISHHATSLLSDIYLTRKTNPHRPLIFVGHSLGGIVIKDMLHQAREPDHHGQYRTIFDSTRGIIFLGTPHRGSGYARLSWVGATIAWLWSGMNIRLLRSLRYDSEILDRVNMSFLRTLINHNAGEARIRICSFAEELSLLKFFSPIVRSDSAFIGLPNEVRETIWANHRDICRFGDNDDPGYKRVYRWLSELVAEAQTPVDETVESRPRVPPEI
ncbi:Alpha/Beta hydrolase protein [Xylariaceae sp. AK1471]|nr:Alpha/Beta hydrolase protein [Xylariaceae sp. AK1471]